MNDFKQLLDGTVEDVENGLDSLSAATLGALIAAEQAGKNRKGVIDALEKAHSAASAVTYTATTDRGDPATASTSSDVSNAAAITTAASLDRSPQSDIAAATGFSTSGAPHQVTEIDLDHPAVDNNPRANTSADQNRIDFNDPTISGSEAVAQSLRAQA